MDWGSRIPRSNQRQSAWCLCAVITVALGGCCSSSVDEESGAAVASGTNDGTASGVANDGTESGVATTVDFYRPTAPPTIDESDIVKSDGAWLHVLSQYTGLSVIDASVPREPKLAARLDVLAGNGGELYVQDQGLLVLAKDSKLSCHALAPSELAHYPSTGIAFIVQPKSAPEVASERCVPGDLVTSRLVGDTLYVVTTAAPVEPDRGWLYAVDVTSPEGLEVVADLPLGGASFEIHMTSEAIFLAEDLTPDTKIRYIDISKGKGVLWERGEIQISGSVPGRFHMDALGNTLRVVTSDAAIDGNHLHVIDTSEPDSLQLLASIGALAPGERLFATRFVGDRAYVVTYQPEIIVEQTVVIQQTVIEYGSDPLWVISLEDPSAPVVLGELEIPGWSDYIFPRGDLLLAVGRGDAGSQVAASLFDVSDPSSPLELRRVQFGSATASSEASSDFRAVEIVEDDLDAPPLVVVPYADNVEVGGTCVPEHHIQLIDLEERSLALRGSLRQSGRVLRTLPLSGQLMAVTSTAVTANDVSNREEPYQVASVAIGNPAVADECVLPPEAPQRVVTVTTVDTVDTWRPTGAQNEWSEPRWPCMCSTSAEPRPCIGWQVGSVLVALAAAAFVVRSRLRTQRVRGWDPRG